VASKVTEILDVSSVALDQVTSIVTDSGAENKGEWRSAYQLRPKEDVSWFWCSAHRLNLVFLDSLQSFPKTESGKVHFIEMLRTTSSFIVTNWSKLDTSILSVAGEKVKYPLLDLQIVGSLNII
jgi:hypothetical protein